MRTFRLYSATGYKVAEETILIPYLLIVAGEITKPFLDFPPCLVAEVLSQATISIDKQLKFAKYQQPGIRYYVMVDTDRETFELYDLKEGKYRLAENDYNRPVDFILDEGCTVEITLNEIWGVI